MTFTERYQKLNTKQQEAVDTIYGPVLVIAWPGSGKTELLAVRIANILKETDASPSNILCLTFTDNAARNMRDRLRRIIGQDAYKVAIHTFHTFGLEILNRFRYKLDADEDFTPIDDIESSRIFHEMLRELPWDHPWKRQSRLGTLRNTIRLLKDAGISPEDFETILEYNEKILNHIGPIIQKYSEEIFALWRKKEDTIQKGVLFAKMQEAVHATLIQLPRHHGLQETLAPTIIRGIDEAIASQESEADSKPITAWKNIWLEKTKDSWRLVDESRMVNARGLLELYRGYTDALSTRGLIDFSDMILRAIRLVEADDQVRAMLAEQYQWVMIDEYQDTNDAQLRLITSMLTAGLESPNIFAVGDDDQSIYKFQGASTRNIRLFRELYADTRLIILEENYRSRSEIIDFSRTMMSESSHSLSSIFEGTEKVFHAVRWNSGEVQKLQFQTELEELTWVASDIEKQIQSGVPPREIAVITKKNSTLELVAKLLLEKGIPVALSKDENIFENEIIRIIVIILSYIDSIARGEDRDDLLVDILAHPMWQIHRLTLWELSRQIYGARSPEKKIWIDALRTHSDRDISKIAHFVIELTLQSRHIRLEDLIDLITGANTLDLSEEYANEGAREQFMLRIGDEDTAFQSPLYTYYFSQERLQSDPTLYVRHLTHVRKLIESIRSFRKSEGRLMLSDFSSYMNLIDEYEVSLSASSLIGSDDAVQCITAHKAKGLEYSEVYAIGLTEKQYKRGKNSGNPLPSNLSLAPEKDNDEDIRRLIYTVCTRAKDRLTLTYAEKSLAEKPDSLVSVLWNTDNWTIIKSELNESSRETLLEREHQDIFTLPYTGEESSFLRDAIEKNFALSATALQNFLDVTSGWPTHFVANNILRFPQAKSESAVYGTAMHKALEDFFKDYKIHGSYKKDILFESFEKKLREDGLEQSIERDFIARGRANLEKLYDKIVGQTYGEIHLEHRFTDVHLESIRLTGAIDRIEITPDGKLIITDYKTGGGFSSLEWGSGYEAIKKWKYKLQLTFYAILFSRSPRWAAWKTREYRLFFIEQDKDTGEFYEVIQYIHDGEIERLEKLISIVMDKIRNLDFPDVSAYEATMNGIRQFEDDLLSWNI